ncbi:MAG: FKBP-type peptidyl-prolyl cis-trans isomerase N-terminal domain-containing protein [Candidatus Kapaibacterium sp.]
MKKIISIIFLSILLFACDEDSSSDKYDGYERNEDLQKPITIVDRMSYTFGYDISTGFNMMDSANNDVNFDYLIAGIIDGLEKREAMLTQEERMKLMTEIQKIQTESERIRYNNKMEEMREVGKTFIELGPKYLAENKKKEGWKVSSTGLQYKPIKVGNGPKPTDNMVVSMNIRGELLNGEVFEDTFKSGNPIEVPIEGVVYGFQEAILMMGVGDIYEVVIPPDLAFKDEGSGQKIPPHSVLIMKFELVEIISTVEEYRQKMRRPPGL